MYGFCRLGVSPAPSSGAVCVSNGTAALHVALHALGVGPGDEVIVPDLTFVATLNAVRYTGATPIVVDVDLDEWTIDVGAVIRAITPKTKAVIAVHLYGIPARLDELRAAIGDRTIAIVEDVAEAPGATSHGRLLGTVGAAGCYSFYGNKIVTTGEGGMVVARDADLHARLRHLRDHGMSPTRRYYHDEIAFNYRMTALQAAIGRAQLERLDRFIAERRQIHEWYRAALSDVRPVILPEPPPDTVPVCWLFTFRVDGLTAADRDRVIARLRAGGVDSRPVFVPMHEMPMYAGPARPNAARIASGGLSLPTYIGLRRDDVAAIAGVFRGALI